MFVLSFIQFSNQQILIWIYLFFFFFFYTVFFADNFKRSPFFNVSKFILKEETVEYYCVDNCFDFNTFRLYKFLSLNEYFQMYYISCKISDFPSTANGYDMNYLSTKNYAHILYACDGNENNIKYYETEYELNDIIMI